MTLEQFVDACRSNQPSGELEGPLLALYWDKQGDWDRAHSIAQQIPTTDGSLVHAYLHREEGDLSNARYWYDRAGASMPNEPLSDEWRAIAKSLLS